MRDIKVGDVMRMASEIKNRLSWLLNPHVLTGIKVVMVGTALVIYGWSIVALGPLPWMKAALIGCLLLGGLLILSGTGLPELLSSIVLLLFAWFVQKVPGVYAGVNPALVDVANGFARFVAFLGAIGVVAFLAWYRLKGRELAEPNMKKLALLAPASPNSHEYPDIEVCKTLQGQSVIIPGKDRFLHTLLIGPTGTGKTTTVLAPLVWQDLYRKYKGTQLGLTVVAPDGEFIHQVASWCDGLGMPYVLIDLDDPNTKKFNPLEGDPSIVSEIMRTVLRYMFGEQEDFFAQAQELMARNTMLLLKKMMGDDLDLFDVFKALVDIDSIANLVDLYEERYGEDPLTYYFKKEAFGRQKDKIHQFAMGLRFQVGDLLGNPDVYNVLVGKSDIDLDKHLAEGGILLVNTAMGKLGRMSNVFGQFIIMHVQNAIFRRPGGEFNRIPHYLVVDELPQYFNPELTQLLNIGRKYRCGCLFTIQGPSQLENGRGRMGVSLRREIMNGCRNKIVIGAANADDAKILAEEFGELEVNVVQKTYKRWSLIYDSQRINPTMKKQFDYTTIMRIPEWHCIVQYVKDGRTQPPFMGRTLEPWTIYSGISREIQKVPHHTVLNFEN